jgi:ubiquitin thioesterase protein OTUB1
LLTAAAIAFTYFETLIREGNVNKFDSEEARLLSMNNLFNSAGINLELIIDFADEMFDLLRNIARSLRSEGDAEANNLLLRAFNDMSTSLSIITYIKVEHHDSFPTSQY